MTRIKVVKTRASERIYLVAPCPICDQDCRADITHVAVYLDRLDTKEVMLCWNHPGGGHFEFLVPVKWELECKPKAEKPDCLHTLSPEELAKVEPLTDEETMGALEEGRAEREAAEKCSSWGNFKRIFYRS